MGLVEVAGLVHRVGDGDARAQQPGGIPGALDLTVGAMGHAGGQEEVTLHGAPGQRLPVARQHRGDGRVAGQDSRRAQTSTSASAFSKAGYSQAEPSSQNDRLVAPGRSTSRRSRRLAAGWLGRKAPIASRMPIHSASAGYVSVDGLRLRPAQGHGDPAAKAGQDQLAVTRGDGEERAGALAVAAPDPLDERRVGRSVLESQEHLVNASPS